MLFRNAEHKKRFQSICKSGLFPRLNESQLIYFETIRINGVTPKMNQRIWRLMK